jgi:hypothetical protein
MPAVIAVQDIDVIDGLRRSVKGYFVRMPTAGG